LRRYYFSMKLPDSYYPKKYEDRWTDWAIEQGIARAYIAMLEGDAIGVGPVMSIKHIHVINGVSTMSADLMFGRMLSTRVLKRDDYTLKADKTQCEIVIGVLSRKPENRLVVVAKYEDFKHLHKKDNWMNDPEGMLVARAKSRACKRHAPDLFVGLYSREEMQDMREDVAAGVYEVPGEFMPPRAQASDDMSHTRPVAQQETPAQAADPLEVAGFIADCQKATKDDMATLEARWQTNKFVGHEGRTSLALFEATLRTSFSEEKREQLVEWGKIFAGTEFEKAARDAWAAHVPKKGAA
jgi:hypothetical protein